MFLERSIAIQQKQSLTVSNNLIQSLRILQFRQDELSAYLEDQAERNPFIELSGTPAPLPLPCAASATVNEQPETRARSDDNRRQETHRAAGPASGPAVRSFHDPDDQIAATLSMKETLREHLHRQIAFALDDATDRAVAVELADNIDPDGYLRTDLDILADTLDTDKAHVSRILGVIQGFEPAGIGARSLAECLRLQLVSRDLLSPAMERLLDNLELLARYDIPRLASVTGASQSAVIEMARIIRSLDPKPGHGFDIDPVLPALPDIVVDCRTEGEFRIELNTDMLPRVLVDRQYYARIKRKSRSEEDRRFVADCMTGAHFLVRCLDQRARTLLSVATEIASRQKAFLAHGRQHLRPLSMKEVAEATGFHESTVCRAIANKYMMTPQGMFDLKYFFSNAIAGTKADEDHSAETVRHRIRQLVANETADTVLCDGQIVDALRESGIDVARRTVAKYRDMLHIPSSLQRRRQKRAQMDYSYA